MLHGSTSPGVAGSELTRLLARLADTPSPHTRPAFAERLGHWLSWPGAVSLSAALTASPAAPHARHSRIQGSEEADFQRVRAGLETAIAAGPDEPASSPTDFGRDALAQQSAAGARLAAIDAVMDQALATQERGLLGLVPLRLQAHFESLQRTAQAQGHWPDTFRDDRDRVLRAELAHRLLPAQGLLDTWLQTTPT